MYVYELYSLLPIFGENIFDNCSENFVGVKKKG